MHGVLSSAHGIGLLLELLADEGLVVAVASARTPIGRIWIDPDEIAAGEIRGYRGLVGVDVAQAEELRRMSGAGRAVLVDLVPVDPQPAS